MNNYISPFESDHFYHVYNRANGNENLFNEDKNYHFFLNKWRTYLNDYLDVWAYCLLPNHFHFLVKISDKERLTKFISSRKSVPEIISNQFRSFFISYTKSYNKVYDRHGSLFQKPFKHVRVDSRDYLLTLIHYIHHNPIHHNFVEDYADWNYSSYSTILSNSPTNVSRKKMLHYFGDRKKFKDSHNQMKNYNKIDHLTIE